uniref:uncharacterized protein C1orf158 homolog n=1 Tax=Urocitellus parryii TaxID=9999 RepID=UPI000E558B7A|nr:uncharacterized protein C1orf158 homolog [Urocitellus parryii]
MVFLGVAPQSFSTPSWQIEKQYSTRVLTGNWLEERGKSPTPRNLTCLNLEGEAWSMVVEVCHNQRLLELTGTKRWFRSVHRAPPTNYGLYERLKQQWMLPKTGWRESVYTSSYPRPPLSTMSRWEHAIPVPPPRLKPHF